MSRARVPEILGRQERTQRSEEKPKETRDGQVHRTGAPGAGTRPVNDLRHANALPTSSDVGYQRLQEPILTLCSAHLQPEQVG